MTSQRLQIRDAFASVVTAVLPVGTKLSKSRRQPLEDTDLPRVVIWMSQDRAISIESEDHHNPHDRMIGLRAELWALNTDTNAENEEAATDALALLIQNAVVLNKTLNSTCSRVTWENTQWDGEVTDKARAACAIDFNAQYTYHPE